MRARRCLFEPNAGSESGISRTFLLFPATAQFLKGRDMFENQYRELRRAMGLAGLPVRGWDKKKSHIRARVP